MNTNKRHSDRENLRQIPPLQVFSDDELDELHYASLEVLRRSGVAESTSRASIRFCTSARDRSLN